MTHQQLVCCFVNTGTKIVAEYALRNNANPISIAEYTINDKLPKEIEEQLPAIEQLIVDIASNIKEE